ncbi:MAG: SprT family zinc-dependent metalloprotease [Spongiibacteraceae bacterium]|jgi:predicted metal-dependent hydrolase|nr:SprT family zinc-dependent metalloprotease [Spongiibacteraceae bacterium]
MTAVLRRRRRIEPAPIPTEPTERSCAAFSYTVRFQRRKTISLHVLNDGAFEVRAPVGYHDEWINEFVNSRTVWALGARERQLQRQQWRQPVAQGAESWFLGEALTLQIERGERFVAAVDGELLRVRAPDPEDYAAVDRRLRLWYRAQAAHIFAERLADCCKRFPRPVAVPPLALRKMRRRWGSCSRDGRITLNVDMVRLPPELIDYVIMHELCHLFEFNHGPRFYRLQSEAVPNWRALEERLRRF